MGGGCLVQKQHLHSYEVCNFRVGELGKIEARFVLSVKFEPANAQHGVLKHVHPFSYYVTCVVWPNAKEHIVDGGRGHGSLFDFNVSSCDACGACRFNFDLVHQTVEVHCRQQETFASERVHTCTYVRVCYAV